MRCPACERSTPPDAAACPGGHELLDVRGVVRLLAPDLRARIDRLEPAVDAWRAARGRRPIPTEELALLPDAPSVRRDHEWRLRRADLGQVLRTLASQPGHRAPRSILDVGAWNGWLSAQLARDGHRVTATDLFAGPQALGARPAMPGTWRAVQLDPLDLGRLEETFDVVILDRCLQFLPDPVAALAHARSVLSPTGIVIATGLAITRQPEAVRARLEAEQQAFRERFGMELWVRPARGYIDWAGVRSLQDSGLRVSRYGGLRRADFRAILDRGRPQHRYGVASSEAPP